MAEMTEKEEVKDRSREDKDFVKVYRRFIQGISDLSLENPTALRVLLFLVRNMDGMNALGVSTQVIADMTNFSRQTVSKAIKYLKDTHWLEVFRQGTSNVYVINPEVVWTSYADEKQYCKMTATLMLTTDDNWELPNKSKTHYRMVDTDFMMKLAQEKEAFYQESALLSEKQEVEPAQNMKEI